MFMSKINRIRVCPAVAIKYSNFSHTCSKFSYKIFLSVDMFIKIKANGNCKENLSLEKIKANLQAYDGSKIK